MKTDMRNINYTNEKKAKSTRMQDKAGTFTACSNNFVELCQKLSLNPQYFQLLSRLFSRGLSTNVTPLYEPHVGASPFHHRQSPTSSYSSPPVSHHPSTQHPFISHPLSTTLTSISTITHSGLAAVPSFISLIAAPTFSGGFRLVKLDGPQRRRGLNCRGLGLKLGGLDSELWLSPH